MTHNASSGRTNNGARAVIDRLLVDLSPSDNATPEELAEKYIAALSIQEEVKALLGVLSSLLVEVIPGTGVFAGSAKILPQQKPGRVQTEGRKVARLVAAKAADDYGVDPDGQPVPPGVLAERVADELIAVSGMDNASFTWRKGELGKRRIPLAKYQQVGEWRTELVVVR